MHRSLVVSGVLGLGTAIVFGAAALAATLFPNGGTVNMAWGGNVMIDKGIAVRRRDRRCPGSRSSDS